MGFESCRRENRLATLECGDKQFTMRSSPHRWKPNVKGTADQGQGRRIPVTKHLRQNLALVRKPQNRGYGKLLILHQKFEATG